MLKYIFSDPYTLIVLLFSLSFYIVHTSIPGRSKELTDRLIAWLQTHRHGIAKSFGSTGALSGALNGAALLVPIGAIFSMLPSVAGDCLTQLTVGDVNSGAIILARFF